MILTITIEAKDKIEAYKIVSHLGFEYKVLSAEINKDKYVFDSKKELSSTKRFLSAKFSKDNLTITK